MSGSLPARCTLVSLVTAWLLGTGAPAPAAILPMPAQLTVALGKLPPVTLSGGAAAAYSEGAGGAATLPAGSVSGTFETALAPPLLTLLDGIGVAAPGLPLGVGFAASAQPATNWQLTFNGTTGHMVINASAYLLMGGQVMGEIPLHVIGVGGSQMFHVLSVVSGTILANPFQLGMVTVMGALNTANGGPHTLVATGFDQRTANGAGTLVLVSPNVFMLGALGTLETIATLRLGVPEPGTLLLVGAGVAALAAAGARRARSAGAPGS